MIGASTTRRTPEMAMSTDRRSASWTFQLRSRSLTSWTGRPLVLRPPGYSMSVFIARRHVNGQRKHGGRGFAGTVPLAAGFLVAKQRTAIADGLDVGRRGLVGEQRARRAVLLVVPDVREIVVDQVSEVGALLVDHAAR